VPSIVSCKAFALMRADVEVGIAILLS